MGVYETFICCFLGGCCLPELYCDCVTNPKQNHARTSQQVRKTGIVVQGCQANSHSHETNDEKNQTVFKGLQLLAQKSAERRPDSIKI